MALSDFTDPLQPFNVRDFDRFSFDIEDAFAVET
jgi:hypothetical protein